MRHLYSALLFSLTIIICSCGPLLELANKKVKLDESDSKPISHTKWTELLQKHVSDGKLNYQGVIEDSILFNNYLSELSSGLPNEKNWSDDEQFAYWVNAYNAFTVKLIIDNYPVNSIKDIKNGVPFVNTVWDIKFIKIENQKFDLNNIEHGILRKNYEDPRIHFAVNCASISCPALLDEAYTADKLNEQLDNAAKSFLYDKSKNNVDPNEPSLSPIFSWFKSDFTKDQSLIEYVNKYLDIPINKNAKLSKTDYDWNLNDVKE